MRRESRLGLLSLVLGLGIASCSDATAPIVPVATALIPGADSVSLSALGESRRLDVTVLDQTGTRMGAPPLMQ